MYCHFQTQINEKHQLSKPSRFKLYNYNISVRIICVTEQTILVEWNKRKHTDVMYN